MSVIPSIDSRRRLRATARALILILAVLVHAGCMTPKRVGHLGGPVGPTGGTGPGGPVLVRIGMVENAPAVELVGDGRWRLSAGAYDEGRLTMVAGEGLSLVRGPHGVSLVDTSRTLKAPWLVATPVDPDHTLRWDGRPWRGELHVIPTPDGAGLTVINVVELERYLSGVVPREIGNGRERGDLAAVAAQAVAARTYTVSRLGSKDAQGFDLYSDVRDQAYGGVDWEDELCNEALELTRGLVMRRGEELSPAYYHSTCGGHTAAVGAIWPYDDHPVLQGRKDQRPDGRPWCAASRYANWETVWTWAELETALQSSLPEYLDYVNNIAGPRWARGAFSPSSGGEAADRPGRLLKLEVRRRTASGRVAELAVTMAAGTYVVRGDRTRWVLRPPTGVSTLLRSSWFELTVDSGRSVKAVGRGWGHGLGLCQMGALGRARAGQGFRDILGHYYPGTRLAPLSRGGGR